jgi:hypothetical protein
MIYKRLLRYLLYLFPLISSISIMLSIIYGLPKCSFNDYCDFFSRIGITFVGYAFLVFIANMALIAWRMYIGCRKIGIDISFYQSFYAVIMSSMGNFCFPFLGALLGQKLAFNKNHYMPAAAIYTYDKIITASVGATLGIIAICFLWPEALSHFFPLFSWELYENLIGIFIIISAIFFYILRQNKEKFKILPIANILSTTLYISFVSTLSWILISSTFLLGIIKLAPKTSKFQAISAGLLVSFLSSLPISISGWSIREFFSIHILKHLGIGKHHALFLAISIGLTSLGALLSISSVVKKRTVSINNYSGRSSYIRNERVEIHMLTYLAAIFLFFHFQHSLGFIKINFCLADIMACIGFLFGVSEFFKNRLAIRFFSLTHFILLTGAAFVMAYTISLMRIGWTPWGISKIFGWIILLGYGAIGALFARNADNQKISLLIKMMALVLCWIIIFKMTCNYLYLWTGHTAHYKISLEGFIGNRNAFALQLMAVLWMGQIFLPYYTKIWAFLYMGIYFTWSRSAHITTLMLLFSSIALHTISWRNLYQTIKYICFYAGIMYLTDLIFFMMNAKSEKFSLFHSAYSFADSDHERWKTIVWGFNLWKTHPLFGNGLGYFIHQTLPHALVIHNSLIWLLAEFGLIGTSIFCFYGATTVHGLFTQWKAHLTRNKALFGILLIFGAMAMVHEIIYQRIIWFMLGLLLVKKEHLLYQKNHIYSDEPEFAH